MPQGSKQKKSNYHHLKPHGGYVHPSLAIRPSNTPTSRANASDGPSTVNERIEHLRRTQNQQAPPSTSDNAAELPERVSRLDRRRIAGPPPPRSWTDDRERRQNLIKLGSSRKAGHGRRPIALDYLPGIELPDQASLLHQTLKSYAIDFDWHMEYDHYYISTLPVKSKGVLLSYVASYGPQEGCDIQALKVLMSTPQRSSLAESTGIEELERLDLGGSVGRALSLKQLGSYWHTRKPRDHDQDSTAALPESWDAPAMPMSIDSPLRFPSLTRLSLALPGSKASWTDLLVFSRHLSTLTHLSLAFWPIPHLALRADAMAQTVPANRNTTSEDSWSEAAYILKQLSRNTPSLQYLDLDGCLHWLHALHVEAAAPSRTMPRGLRDRAQFDFGQAIISPGERSSGGGAEWSGAWRHISHVSVRQGWIPKGLDVRVLYALYEARGKHAANLDGLLAPAQTREPEEAYTMFSSSHAVRESVQAETNARHQRAEWFKMEVEALVVEAHVRRLRSEARARGITGGGNGVCIFDHGWGRTELVEAGYDDHDLWEAGF